MGAIKAIDVSTWQGNINFDKVKAAGVKAVIIRSGYLGKTDAFFDRNVQGAQAAGFDIGAYTYIMSETPADAIKEANETVKRLEKYKGAFNYPIFGDMEDKKYCTSRFNKQSRTAILLSFLETIAKAGYYAAVYINPAWLETFVDKSRIVGIYDIWLAAWTNSPNKPTKYNYGQVMWQWGTETVSGIIGNVDSDLVYIDYPEKIRAAKKNFLKAKSKDKSVTLAYNAVIRDTPREKGRRLGCLSAGTKCVIVEGTDAFDPVSKYTYIQLAGGKSQWIVKSAIKM